ncbi:hypothetical protein ACAX43_23075 [Paraburkholderia sp. IW21]|uniref:hypothetical protein n=1 Tax=Paraburkholderia sp. IW21 TaxID=3242488 RepID=UPI003522E844
MEKWLVVLGIWAMCATCAVLFIRGATGGSGKREPDEGRARPASRASAGEARAALNDTVAKSGG